MKTVFPILVCLVVWFSPVSMNAEAEGEKDTDPSFSWSQFWEEFKKDWNAIGQDAKEHGTDIGRTVSDEVKKIPGQIHSDLEEAKNDFKQLMDQSEAED